MPPPPLFQDELQVNIIPQVSLLDLIKKYDGKTVVESENSIKSHILTSLPPYLFFILKRFTKSSSKVEKNPTIVNFPIKGLDMREYSNISENVECRYDLVANVCHSGTVKDGSYHVHVYNAAKDSWFSIQDLVVSEILPPMILLEESCILVWKKRG